MKFKRALVAVVAAGALAVSFAGVSSAQDTPESLIEECQGGPIPAMIDNPEYSPDETIPNPDFDDRAMVRNDGYDIRETIPNPDFDPELPSSEENSETVPNPDYDPRVWVPNPDLDTRETVPNPAHDLPELIVNEAYEVRLDPSGNGIACGIEDVAIWEGLVEPGETPSETPAPTETPAPSETPAPTTEQRQEQSQTVVIVPQERSTADRVPLQSVPSGPVDRP